MVRARDEPLGDAHERRARGRDPADGALRHPERLRTLTSLSTPHPAAFRRSIQDGEQRDKSSYMLFFRSPKAEEVLLADGSQRLVGMVMGRGLQQGFFDERDREAYLAAWSQPGALTGGLNYYRAAQLGPLTADMDVDVSNLLGDSPARASLVVRVPTLVIWGEQDTALLSGNLDGLEQHVPELTLRRIRSAIEMHIAGLREDGTSPPRPRSRIVLPGRTSRGGVLYACVDVAA